MAGKVRYNELTENQKKKFLGEFYDMIALLQSREEVKSFFKDLLSLSEVVMISRRIQVAAMLLEGYGYQEIREELSVGYSTISQVEKWVHNGFGGYEKAIARHKKKYAGRKEFDPEEMVPYSAAWVRKKYPLHYLLQNIGKKRKK